MTICIASLAENGKKLVLAADQMITANIPISYEFETDDVQKIYKINEKAYVLTAGNAIFAYEIVTAAARKIQANQAYSTIEEIAEIVRKEFVIFRNKIIARNVLEPRGLSLEGYYNIQKQLFPGVIQEVENALINNNIGVELIIAGQNDNEECHIFTVTHPGQLLIHDVIGYVCVGSGSPHATYYLIGSNYKKNMQIKDVKKLIEEAKHKSEVAPGVGKETTVICLPEIKNGGKHRVA